MSFRDSHARFTRTHWSIVLAARGWPAPEACDAIGQLCRIYWYPLYAFIRRRGHAPPDAQDLTQSFFAHVFEQETLQRVDRQKGSFRAFLLAALGYFLNDQRARQRTIKRGGQATFISWDEMLAEERFGLEPAMDGPDEAFFDRRWALALLDHVLGRLEREYAAAGKAELFTVLQAQLTSDPAPNDCLNTAVRLRMSEGATRVALHRLRRRFGEMLRTEVAQTVSIPEEVDEEIRHLFAALQQ
jgi:RNA polymerase sigma-70 factor (ECF subfamily)